MQRRIQHPGPAAAARHQAVPTALRAVALVLPAGATLQQAVTDGLAAHGAGSAVLALGEATLFPFAHVLPALSRTAEHAVYFSERFDADAPVRLETARVTAGLRDGLPSLHCHAQWRDAAGALHIGHLLPADVVLTTPLPATAWLLADAAYVGQADEETRFTLFQPQAQPQATATADAQPTSARALALRLAPNADVCTSLEAICRQHGITRATLRGGVGSTVGAAFDDGRQVLPFVTELLVRAGRVRPDAHGAPVAEVDISLVDHTGGLADGRLQRGANPVLVTFEVVLDPD